MKSTRGFTFYRGGPLWSESVAGLRKRFEDGTLKVKHVFFRRRFDAIPDAMVFEGGGWRVTALVDRGLIEVEELGCQRTDDTVK